MLFRLIIIFIRFILVTIILLCWFVCCSSYY